MLLSGVVGAAKVDGKDSCQGVEGLDLRLPIGIGAQDRRKATEVEGKAVGGHGAVIDRGKENLTVGVLAGDIDGNVARRTSQSRAEDHGVGIGSALDTLEGFSDSFVGGAAFSVLLQPAARGRRILYRLQ